MNLTVPAIERDGIWFPDRQNTDVRADAVWSAAARQNPIHAAAAWPDADPFGKFPNWIAPHFTHAEGTLLDAGCGYGRVSIPLLKQNPRLRCVAVDASPVMLQLFQKLALSEGVGDRVEFFCGNIDSLPFPDADFPLLLTSAVLLHLPKTDVRTVIGEFRRVLAPGGKAVLVASFPNALNPEGLPNLVNSFRRKRNGPVRSYSRHEVARLFAGFSTADIQGHHLVVLPRKLGPLKLPFDGLSRKVNRYCSDRFHRLKQSTVFVSHHDVVAVK